MRSHRLWINAAGECLVDSKRRIHAVSAAHFACRGQEAIYWKPELPRRHPWSPTKPSLWAVGTTGSSLRRTWLRRVFGSSCSNVDRSSEAPASRRRSIPDFVCRRSPTPAASSARKSRRTCVSRHSASRNTSTIRRASPFPDRRYLLYRLDPEWNRKQIERFSKADALAWPKYERFWEEFAELVEPTLL